MIKDELFAKDTVVDREGYWHFPNGEELLVKGKRLVNKSGYKVFDYDGNEVNLNYIENKVKYNKGGGVCVFRSYAIVREYVDRKNKIYYVYFGENKSHDMWC